MQLIYIGTPNVSVIETGYYIAAWMLGAKNRVLLEVMVRLQCYRPNVAIVWN